MKMAEAFEREGLKIAGASAFGGTSFWMEGPEGLDADRLVHILREDGVLVESGASFFPKQRPLPLLPYGFRLHTKELYLRGDRQGSRINRQILLTRCDYGMHMSICYTAYERRKNVD